MSEAVLARPDADPSDPYLRRAQTFPQLSEEMARRAAAYGVEERVPAGTYIFQRGDRGIDFFVLQDGAIEVFEIEPGGAKQLVTVHGEREFTGELDLFNNRRVLVSGLAVEDSRVVRIKPADFRRLISAEPDIGEIVMRAFILRRVGLIQHGQGGVVLIGPMHGGDTLRLERFLSRNGHPHRLLDTDSDPDAGGFLDCFHITPDQLPVVITPGDTVLKNPSNSELADELGITENFTPGVLFDLVVVGAGPAGLAAAVYGASEGLGTLVIEAMAPGGQAGTSSKIENYLGFPTGISGMALAGRAQVQAQKFGARLAISRAVTRLNCDREPYRLFLEDGQVLEARSIVVATGARYRKLDVPEYERFEGLGIHYAATNTEARLCTDEEIVIVGGGNSAGQAAMFLSRHVRHVNLLVRSEGLAATMSDYLVRRILSSRKITLRPFTEITALTGDNWLRRVTWTHRRSGEAETKDIANVFVMIGAAPNTDWLEGCLDLDDKGFVLTGRDAAGNVLPSPYATSQAGVFAVGDVRSGSVKRVASSVGEGSVVVQAIHQYLHPATE